MLKFRFFSAYWALDKICVLNVSWGRLITYWFYHVNESHWRKSLEYPTFKSLAHINSLLLSLSMFNYWESERSQLHLLLLCGSQSGTSSFFTFFFIIYFLPVLCTFFFNTFTQPQHNLLILCCFFSFASFCIIMLLYPSQGV